MISTVFKNYLQNLPFVSHISQTPRSTPPQTNPLCFLQLQLSHWQNLPKTLGGFPCRLSIISVGRGGMTHLHPSQKHVPRSEQGSEIPILGDRQEEMLTGTLAEHWQISPEYPLLQTQPPQIL